MKTLERPAPVVTIVDPQRPPGRRGPADRSRRTRPSWRPTERALAATLVVLLLLAVERVADLRAAEQTHARLARLQLQALPVEGGPVTGRDTYLRLVLELVGRADVLEPVHGLSVDGGWQPLAELTAITTGQRVVLRHAVTCGTPLLLPTRLTVSVVVDGQRHALHLPVRSPTGSATAVAHFCGPLSPSQAVVLVASSVAATGGHSTVDLALVNVGSRPVQVEGALTRGFAFRSSHLPYTVPARPAGELRFLSLEPRRIVFEIGVSDCIAALRSLESSEVGDATPDHITLRVAGEGRSEVMSVDVQGIRAYLTQAWTLRCSTVAVGTR